MSRHDRALHGRSVVITGAGTGLGRATAVAAAAAGARVFATVLDPAEAEPLRTETGGERVVPIVLDVRSPAAVAAAAGRVAEALDGSPLWALVNNAGVCIGGPVEAVGIDRWREQFEVNLFGPIELTKAMLPLLRRTDGDGGGGAGRVVNVSSISGRCGSPLLGPYQASKHALEAASDALRMELAPQGVHVVLVEPGAIATPIWGRGAANVAAVADGFTAEHGRLYGPWVTALTTATARIGRSGLAAETAARTVLRAVTARHPRTRYLVGRDARLLSALKATLPDRAFDRMILSTLGMSKLRRP